MAKIYANKDDVKRVYNKEDGQIRFEKKYYKIHNYLLTFEVFPVVLVPIIMDYVNDLYVVEYIFDTVLRIKQITYNYNTTLLRDPLYKNPITNQKKYCYIFLSSSIYHNLFMEGELNLFTIFDEKILNKTYNGYYIPLSCFFNYFMKTYYGKKNYITPANYHHNYYNYNKCINTKIGNVYISRKIHDYKQLTNVIVIFKILSKIIVRMEKK